MEGQEEINTQQQAQLPPQPQREVHRDKCPETAPLLPLTSFPALPQPQPVLPQRCLPSLLLLAKPIKLLPWPQLKAPHPGEETTEEASLLPSTPNHQLILMREDSSLPKDPYWAQMGGQAPPP